MGLEFKELLRSLFFFLSRLVRLHFSFSPCKLLTPLSSLFVSPLGLLVVQTWMVLVEGIPTLKSVKVFDAQVSKSIRRSFVRAIYIMMYLNIEICVIYIILMDLSYWASLGSWTMFGNTLPDS